MQDQKVSLDEIWDRPKLEFAVSGKLRERDLKIKKKINEYLQSKTIQSSHN